MWRSIVTLGAWVVCLAPAVQASAAVTYSFVLEADQVVPPSGSIAAGQGAATLDDLETEINVVVQHGVSDATQAIVRNAGRGSNGPDVCTLGFVSSTAFSAVCPLDSNGVVELKAGRLYVQIDSITNPGGDIRGQIDLNPNPQPGDVIITEIMYNPASQEGNPPTTFVSNPEWIELFNTTFTDIEIGGWFFQDEDVESEIIPGGDPCTLVRSGTFPSFVLRSFQLVVVIPDGVLINGNLPSVADFKTAWGLGAEVDVIQVTTNGTVGGAIVGRNLSNNPVNDTFDVNDLPLVTSFWKPCDSNGFDRPDNEIVTLNDGSQIIDVVNYDDDFDLGFFPDWPPNSGFSSISLVPVDYPNATDVSSFTAAGNDIGSSWISHTHGDVAGGQVQTTSAGVYGGADVGSPGYLFGATPGNRAPTAIDQQVLMQPGETKDITLDGTDKTRPFFGFLLFVIKSLPQNGQLIDVASAHVITPADVAGGGYLMPRIPFELVRYVNDGTCGVDSFLFATHDGLLESNPATVDLYVQCGDVVITEVMYNPDSLESNPAKTEWVELYNTTETAIDLAGWYLEDDLTRSGDFPSYILGAKSTTIAIPSVVDPVEFNDAWAAPYVHLTTNGDTGGSGKGAIAGSNLHNDGESLRLMKPGGPVPQITDAVFFVSGWLDPNWPTVWPDGPSIYVTSNGPYDPATNDAPAVWDTSGIGVDGAYLVQPTPAFDGVDIGSPGYLPGVTQGSCGAGGPLRDGNGDGVVNMMDFSHFAMCCVGPGASPPQNCACFDVNTDGDVDLQDFASFQANFNGP